MKKRYNLPLGIAVILLLFSVFFSAFDFISPKSKSKSKDGYFVELNKDKMTELKDNDEKQNVSNSSEVDKSFSSNLPLVLIDLDEKIPDGYYFDKTTDSFKLSEAEPFAYGEIKVINNEQGINKLSDDEEMSSKMKIKYRGNTSLTYDKKQFGIKLLDDDGNENEVPILGMEADEDWILNISMSDKSLMRNYIAFNVCGLVMENTPNVRYCEVIIKNGDSYEYQGLYLMMESIKKSSGRVDIQSYKEGKNFTSYLLRRDRYNEDGIMLDTKKSSKEEISFGYLEVKYPSEKEMNDKLYNYILNDVDKIEQIIYSDNYEVFKSYNHYIDEDSFVDYFLLNEFFMNLDAGRYSTYLYKEPGGKLKIGPVWDFDICADNYSDKATDLKNVMLNERPWFEKLVNSSEFTNKLINRYKELRRTVLSDKNIAEYIDETSAYIEEAQERDYKRWNESYSKMRLTNTEDDNGLVIDRNSDNFDEEVQRLKQNLNIHGNKILSNLEELDRENDIYYTQNIYAGFSVIFLILFFSSVIIVRRQYS